MLQRVTYPDPLCPLPQGNGSPSPQQTVPALTGSGTGSMGCLKHGACCCCSLVLLGLPPATAYL